MKEANEKFVQNEKKFLAAEAEAKRLLLEKEKSLQEAAEKLFQSEKQLQELRFEVDNSLSLRAF